MKEYKRWCATPEDLSDMTPLKARDLIVKCYFEAQKETFAAAKEKLHMQVDDAQLQKSVTAAVRMAFKECGGDFENPDKKCLQMAIVDLANQAASWKTPQEIMDHHKDEIKKVLDRLK